MKKFAKNGTVFMANNSIQERAFLASGYVEVKEGVEKSTSFTSETVTSENQTHTKTEINRMPIADLRKLASENGLDESMSGAEIKKSLIDKFNL